MSSLREQCKERIKIAFDSIRAITPDPNFILVVDQSALKILSSAIKMMELVNFGINLVEKLELKRKKFTKLEAVYMIHPDSYEKVINDFTDGEEPQYRHIHILTLTKIPIHVMDALSKEQQVTKRLKTLKQLSLNFLLHSQNQFLIAPSQSETFEVPMRASGLDRDILLTKTIDQLSTVLTSMTEFYIVEILYSSPLVSDFSERVALGLKEKLEKQFDTYHKYGVQNLTSSAPPTTFLILDRSFDPVSPLVRDFHYMSLLYDLKNAEKHQIQVDGKEKKTMVLDEGDEIFGKFKNAHIAVALTGLTDDFQSFSKGHVAAKMQKNDGAEMKLQQMREVMKKIPQYTESKDKYSFHMDMINVIMKCYEKEKFKVQGELEQNIITQCTEAGKPLKSSQLFKEMMERVELFPSEKDKARILLITLMCLELKPKEKNVIVEKIQQLSSYKNIYQNLHLLTGSKLQRLPPRVQKKEDNLILDRHHPKLEDIVRKISTGGQADLKYLRVGTQGRIQKQAIKNTGTLGRKKLGGQLEKAGKPRLIIFVSSAIGYNEIRSISQFEGDFKIYLGSHNFTTQTQYLNMVEKIQNDDEL